MHTHIQYYLTASAVVAGTAAGTVVEAGTAAGTAAGTVVVAGTAAGTVVVAGTAKGVWYPPAICLLIDPVEERGIALDYIYINAYR